MDCGPPEWWRGFVGMGALLCSLHTVGGLGGCFSYLSLFSMQNPSVTGHINSSTAIPLSAKKQMKRWKNSIFLKFLVYLSKRRENKYRKISKSEKLWWKHWFFLSVLLLQHSLTYNQPVHNSETTTKMEISSPNFHRTFQMVHLFMENIHTYL